MLAVGMKPIEVKDVELEEPKVMSSFLHLRGERRYHRRSWKHSGEVGLRKAAELIT